MPQTILPTVRVSDLPSAEKIFDSDNILLDQSDATRKTSVGAILSQKGVMTMVSFTEGGFLSSKKDVAYFEEDGMYYVWDGEYPKTIPIGSSPNSTGAVGVGAWRVLGEEKSTEIIDLGEAGNKLICNPAGGGMFLAKLTSPMCHIEIETNNRQYQTFTLSLLQGTGANLVSWPASVRFSYGRPPVLSYKKDSSDIFQLVTYDGGNTWLGMLVMGGVGNNA